MLEAFFNPRGVAVVGASRDRTKVGGSILANLIEGGFSGGIYPVNPSAQEIMGRKSYADVMSVPDPVDMAVVVVKAGLVPQVIDDCARKKISGAVVISAGFKEAGPDGYRLEKEIVKMGMEKGLRVWGPNCLGLINTFTKLNASFAHVMPLQGNIAFLSQSGALCTAILDWSITEGIGFSKFASLGNKSDIDEVDLLEALENDEDTKVIAGYLESINDGQKFLKVAARVTRKKPVVLIKAGRSAAGAKAASSHTGSLAGADSAYSAAFKQSGVIRAEALEELFDYAMAFARQPLPQGRNVAVLTNAGGPGIMATDACQANALNLPTFNEATLQKLKAGLPPTANIYNPVDVIGDALVDRYELALDALLSDSFVDGLIVLLTPQAMTQAKETAEAIARLSKGKGAGKPVLASFMGGEKVAPGIKILKEKKVPNYLSPERAAGSFAALARQTERLKRTEGNIPVLNVGKAKAGEIINRVMKESRVNLLSWESREVVSSYGFKVPAGKLVTDAESAVSVARETGFPVVMKIVSPEILHKTEVGGVRLKLMSDQEVRDAFELMMYRVGKRVPNAHINGVTVEAMTSAGREVILGMSKDPQFGHVFMFGLGGIYVEVLKDVSFRVSPFTEQDCKEMVQEIRAYPLLSGVRGQTPADIPGIIDGLMRLQQLCFDFPQIVELDINPLMVNEMGQGTLAVDARITLEKPREG